MELTLQNISKKYRDKTAVDNITLTLAPGVWGLLGANGAGKTTLMKMIAGILKPTGGKVLYDGVEIGKLGGRYRDIFGYLPQEFGFYPEFKVEDYLQYMAALKGLEKKQAKEKIEGLLAVMTLKDVRKKKIIKLSGGMKRRVGIAQALLNDPEVLILDEPTSGLDPGERVKFRNLLSEFAKDRIVLISTHIVSDVEYIASQNAIMKDGRLLTVGKTETLTKKMEGKVWSGQIPADEIGRYESRLRIVSLRNEDNGQISIRYLAENPEEGLDKPAAPRFEDLYLWLFPEAEGRTEQK